MVQRLYKVRSKHSAKCWVHFFEKIKQRAIVMRFDRFFFATLLFAITQTSTKASDQNSPLMWDGVEVVRAAPKQEYSIALINEYLKQHNLPVRIDERGQIWVGHTRLTNTGLVLKITNQALTAKDIEKIRSIFTTTRSKL